MSATTRIIAAQLAIETLPILDADATADRLFSLCIFFESWIELGGDETQKRMKLLPDDTATILKLVK